MKYCMNADRHAQNKWGYCQSTDIIPIPTVRKEEMDSAYSRNCLVSPPTELRPKKDQDQRHGAMFYNKTTLQFVTQTNLQELT